MKRLFLFAAVVIIASMWSSPAQAQYGFGGFGGNSDPNAEIDTQRSNIKSQIGKYAKPHTSRARPRGQD